MKLIIYRMLLLIYNFSRNLFLLIGKQCRTRSQAARIRWSQWQWQYLIYFIRPQANNNYANIIVYFHTAHVSPFTCYHFLVQFDFGYSFWFSQNISQENRNYQLWFGIMEMFALESSNLRHFKGAGQSFYFSNFSDAVNF